MGVIPRWGLEIAETEAIPFPNERIIEIHLGHEALALHQPGWVLDAGCAMNRHLAQGGEAQIIHLTQNIQSEKAHLSNGKRSYLNGDLRNLRIFASRAFDRTLCLSTLEHIGMDNRTYLGSTETDPESMLDAVSELCRVTSRLLLFSVPFNVEKITCDQWRFFTKANLAQVRALAESYGYATETRFYGRNDAQQWYGGGPHPVDASLTDFPAKVNAIAVMRCVRER